MCCFLLLLIHFLSRASLERLALSGLHPELPGFRFPFGFGYQKAPGEERLSFVGCGPLFSAPLWGGPSSSGLVTPPSPALFRQRRIKASSLCSPHALPSQGGSLHPACTFVKDPSLKFNTLNLLSFPARILTHTGFV